MLLFMVRNGLHYWVFPLQPGNVVCVIAGLVGFPPSIWSFALDRQQQSFFDLAEWHYPNLGSKVLSLCRQRIAGDWKHILASPCSCWKPLLIRCVSMVRSIVQRIGLTLGLTRGYRRIHDGYNTEATSNEMTVLRRPIASISIKIHTLK